MFFYFCDGKDEEHPVWTLTEQCVCNYNSPLTGWSRAAKQLYLPDPLSSLLTHLQRGTLSRTAVKYLLPLRAFFSGCMQTQVGIWYVWNKLSQSANKSLRPLRSISSISESKTCSGGIRRGSDVNRFRFSDSANALNARLPRLPPPLNVSSELQSDDANYAEAWNNLTNRSPRFELPVKSGTFCFLKRHTDEKTQMRYRIKISHLRAFMSC